MNQAGHGKGPDGLLEEFSFDSLRFKPVVVQSPGISYRGILLGADAEWLYLKGTLRYLVLPMERISAIRLAEERDSFDPRKSIDAEFYRQQD